MNAFDLLIIFLLFIGVLYGAVRGGAKLFMGLLSLWLALIVALWLYKPFSSKILAGVFVSASPVVLDSFSFIMLLIIFTGAASVILLITNKAPEQKKKKKAQDLNEMLDNANKTSGFTLANTLGGIVMGFIVTAIWLSIIFGLAQYVVFSTPGLAPGLAKNMANSALLPYVNTVLGYLYLSVKFFTPGQLPAIFSAII